MKRREFIYNTSLGVAGCLYLPSFLSGIEINEEHDKKLVIIQLGGGNDGLNTFVPYRNDIYYRNRPKISIPSSKIIKLSDEIGLNPSLESLRLWYDKGYVSIMNNVGYPNPNRSHFRSMDIWQTGNVNKTVETGWIGRYLDSDCGNCASQSHRALEIATQSGLTLNGELSSGFCFEDRRSLELLSDELKTSITESSDMEGLSYIRKMLLSVNSSADYLIDKLELQPSRKTLPPYKLSRDLSLISTLIKAEAEPKVYYANHNGFDTHAKQNDKQDSLLTALGESLSWFIETLEKAGKFNSTLILVFSEFGRRVRENASEGTDHGAANSVMVISGGLKKSGITNELVDLSNLDQGDLIYNLDFRSIYKTILGNWLNADDSKIIDGKLPRLDFI